MSFRDKLSKMSSKDIHTNNQNHLTNLNNSQPVKLNDQKYQNDGVSNFVFDLTNPNTHSNLNSTVDLTNNNSNVFLDLTGGNSNKGDTIDLTSMGFPQPEPLNNNQSDDFSMDDFKVTQEDLNSLLGLNNNSQPTTVNNNSEENVIIKSTKSPSKKKTRLEEINEFVNMNVNFWWRMNALYIRPEHPDPNIKYETLYEIKDPYVIDFEMLKKKNYRLYKAIEDGLEDLKKKYHDLVEEIKKSEIFKEYIDAKNIRLEDIDITQLRSALVHKYDVRLRNFLKNFNPYNRFIRDGQIHQEPKDLLAYKQEFETDVIYDVIGYSAIFPFLRDRVITEIMVIGPYKNYIEFNGKLVKTKVAYVNDEPLRRYAREIASSIDRPLDSVSLSVDSRLPDGSRFHGIIPPISRFGTTLTIRKFSEEKLLLENLIEKKSLSTDMAYFIRSAVASRLNTIVAGGTGSGKTTMLNICSNYIGEYERTITVEDSAELQLIQDHVVSLETKETKEGSKARAYTIRDLVKECLRMRPDRILCGECRGGEAWDMLVAMNTGHEGSMTTVHSNNPIDTVKRVANMVAQVAGDGVPMRVIYEQIASSVDLIIYQARLVDGSRKTTYISEIRGYNVITQSVEVVDLYRYFITGQDEEGKFVGEFRWTGNLPSEEIIYKILSKGHKLPPEMQAAYEAQKGQRKAEFSLEDEKRLVDDVDLDVGFKERVKLALEILRVKESENEIEIIEELDVPKTLKQKLQKLLQEEHDRKVQKDTVGI